MKTTYKVTPAWQLARQLMECTEAPNMILCGPPATGKSTAAATYGDPATVAVLGCHEDTMPGDLLCAWHLAPAPSGAPGMKLALGAGACAWVAGGRLVLDEIDRLPLPARAVLHQLAEIVTGRRIGLSLDDGTIIHPARGFHIVATSNLDPQQLRENLGDALYSRFLEPIVLDTISPEIVGSFPPAWQQAVIDSFGAEPERRITPRQWRAYLDLAAQIGEEPAARAAFGLRGPEILDTLKIAKA